MRDALRRALVDNAPLKALSFAIAVALFVIVRGDKDATSSVYVKVEYTYPSDRVLVSDTVPEVRVTVRGPYTRVSRLDEHDVEPVHIDLTRLSDGDLRMDDQLIRLPAGLRVAAISPPSVRLRFEPRAERVVPVQATVDGQPAGGFRLARSTVTPRTVRVTGARSVVDSIAHAQTVPLRIADARDAVHEAVRLAPAPPHAEWSTDGPITVDVEIEPALAEKVVKAVPLRVIGAARLEARTEPETADVVLRGPSEALAALPAGVPSLIVDGQVEDQRPPGAYRKRVSVAGLPAGIAAELRPDAVTLVTRRRHE